MKRWRIVLVGCLVAAFMCIGLTGCQQEEYKPASKQATVSAQALGKAGTLRVGVNASAGPLAGQSTATSEIVGIDVDVASYMADLMGLKVEIIDVGADPESALANGTVDVVLGINTANDPEMQYWRSSSYLGAGVALFARPSQTKVPQIGSKTRIAAQDRSTPASRVMSLYGDDCLVNCTDLEAAYNALSKGSVDYVASDAVVGTYAAYRNGSDARIIALLQDPVGYCAGVAQSNSELQGAVSSAIDTLVNGGMMNIIQSKWYGTSVNLSSVPVVKVQPVAAAAPAPASASDDDGDDEDEDEDEE